MTDKGKFARTGKLLGTRVTAVIAFFDPTAALPVDPTTGDRYIASATANGWTINNIYEWNGASWVATVAAANRQVMVTNHSAEYLFLDGAWTLISVPKKKGRNAYLANTPSVRAAEWNADATNRHTVRVGRPAYADYRPNEEV